MTIEQIKAVLAVAGTPCRAIWAGDDGSLRVGRSGDVVTMIEDLGLRAIGATTAEHSR